MWIWAAVVIVAAWCVLSVPTALILGRVLGAIAASQATSEMATSPVVQDAA